MLLKLHSKLAPGWVLIQVNIDPIQEIGPKVGGGHSFVSGPFFARLRHKISPSVADLGGGKGVQMYPLWRLVMYFCVHNCMSPSNDYAAVACSNNNQAQLHTHISVPY